MRGHAFVAGFVFAATGALSICSAAAADLPPASSPAPVAYAPPVYNCTGFYVGGHVGGGFAGASWSDPFSGGSNSFNSSGFLGGAQVGANAQFNALVVGLERDFRWLGLKGNGTDSVGDLLSSRLNWTSTVTGRVGAAFDRLLVYGKGGVAFADDQSGFTDMFANSASINSTRIGWTAGAGLEYALNKNWSLRLEYDYLGFGSRNLTFTTPTTPSYSSNAVLNVQEVKAGVDFHFGP